VHLFFIYTIDGLVIGGVYGIAASGLVLTYNTSGIFNFAHGAEAMLGAFLYWQVRYGWHWPAPLALIAVLGVFGPLMGAILYGGIMRGLRDTAEVTKVIVTVALMLGILALSTWIWNPTVARTDTEFFGADAVKIFGSKVSYHELIALAVAVAIAVGLRLFFYRTRTGVAMRGGVDDPGLLRLNGHNPERLAALSWAMGSFLAVLAGVLVTPISGGALDANFLTLLVIDAFAAAMFGRLRSLPRTFVGAIVLGLAATYVLAYFPKSWAWTSDFRISLPMIILFLVLIVLPQDRLRGATVRRTRERFRVPSVRTAVIAGVVLVVGVILLRQLMVDSDVTSLTVGMTFAVIALSLTLLTGYAGEMNLAAVSFGAIGTLIVFHVGIRGHGLASYSTLWGVILGVIAAAVVGALVALPALRLRGLYLALATMAFGVFLTDMVLQDVGEHKLWVVHTRFSLFTTGSLLTPPLKVGPLNLHNGTTFLVTVTVVFALLGIGLVALRNSSYGRRLTAMKDSPAAAATLGQNLVKLKLSVFMLSAGIAGLGGILMSTALGSVTSDSFYIFLSLALVMLVVVFGVGYVSGALLGGILSGVGFGVIAATFNHLGEHHVDLHGLWLFLGHFAAVAPALIGIGVGRSPGGAVADIAAGYRPLAKVKSVIIVGAAAVALCYGLALGGAINNWTFFALVAVVFLLLPVAGQVVAPEAFFGADEVARRAAEVPLELVGVDSPYTAAGQALLDRRLGLDVSLTRAPDSVTRETGRTTVNARAGEGADDGSP
jgi:branched-subunit amino acid ABC-type transport system permease component